MVTSCRWLIHQAEKGKKWSAEASTVKLLKFIFICIRVQNLVSLKVIMGNYSVLQWCPPCRALLPELRKASIQLFGQLKFGTLDCTVHETLCNMVLRYSPSFKCCRIDSWLAMMTHIWSWWHHVLCISRVLMWFSVECVLNRDSDPR